MTELRRRGVEPDDFCIEWSGWHLRDGYAMRGKQRVVRLLTNAPQSMEVDHLCRNTGCIRLDHLELVTHGENARRGVRGNTTLDGLHKRCGEANWKFYVNSQGRNVRKCLSCTATYMKRYRHGAQ